MIAMLKNETKCNIFIGQNGRIWITGRDHEMELAIKSLLKIERETHISGLTDRVTRFLKEQKKEENIEKDKEKKESEGILDELLWNEK
jgi:exosome complex component RRP4